MVQKSFPVHILQLMQDVHCHFAWSDRVPAGWKSSPRQRKIFPRSVRRNDTFKFRILNLDNAYYNCVMPDTNRTVWSSEEGDLRKKSRLTSDPSLEGAGGRVTPHQQTAFLHRESGGRGGKVVSLVKNLLLSEEDMKALAKKLKQECGAGGTVKGAVIEIQGEHRQRMAEVLQKLGYKVMIAGG